MVQINFALKEVNCKVVFYGPGMSGKTTNLEIVHQKAPEEHKGDLTSISTDGDRTLFFDFMPLDLGKIAGMQTKFSLYTVPGQCYYNSTRKLVLQGVDGVIFVADSAADKVEENIESYQNLIDNLAEYGKDIRDLPHVIQYNKRDLPNAMSVEDLDRAINTFGVPTFEAVACTGEGVFPTLKTLAGIVLESINKTEKSSSSRGRGRPEAAAPAPAPVAAAAEAPSPRPAAAPRPAAPAPRPAAARPAAPARPAGAAATARPAVQQVTRGRTATAARATRSAPTSAAAASPKGEGKGFLVAFVVLLIAAVAGVAFLMMQQNS
ncbi:MAG: GTPase [Planctomycetes bacterium]|nr:GTPase [Planctomycetota bacterium]